MEALPSFTGYLIFAAPVFQALLATWKHDDLTSALIVCVVWGSPIWYCYLLLPIGTLQSNVKWNLKFWKMVII